MGFTAFEKKVLRETLRDKDTISSILGTEYPDEIIEFLKQENLLGQVRDYAIISAKAKLHKPENLTMTYLLDGSTYIYDILAKWQSFLSPPVTNFF